MTVPTANSAPTTVPGNLSGTLAGAAATMAVGFLSSAGYLTIAATAIGVPEATISVLAMAIVGGIVNYGVSHVTGIKSLNDLYKALPTTYAQYPAEKATEGTTTNLINGG